MESVIYDKGKPDQWGLVGQLLYRPGQETAAMRSKADIELELAKEAANDPKRICNNSSDRYKHIPD